MPTSAFRLDVGPLDFSAICLYSPPEVLYIKHVTSLKVTLSCLVPFSLFNGDHKYWDRGIWEWSNLAGQQARHEHFALLHTVPSIKLIENTASLTICVQNWWVVCEYLPQCLPGYLLTPLSYYMHSAHMFADKSSIYRNTKTGYTGDKIPRICTHPVPVETHSNAPAGQQNACQQEIARLPTVTHQLLSWQMTADRSPCSQNTHTHEYRRQWRAATITEKGKSIFISYSRVWNTIY